jgi:hypothetical protein
MKDKKLILRLKWYNSNQKVLATNKGIMEINKGNSHKPLKYVDLWQP